MTTCAVGPCSEPRINAGMYCKRHGPMGHRSSRASSRVASAQICCPHCQVRGQVSTKRVSRKRGVSGGKATGAVLTAGVSLLLVGLSRKETVTEATCGNCRVRWTV